MILRTALLLASLTLPSRGQPQTFLHAFHAQKLQLACKTCHLPVQAGSVTLKRPGHAECKRCHQDAFEKANQRFCAQCHASNNDLLAYPRHSATRAILSDFSHLRHVDAKARVNAATGFRADCTFCHKFEISGQFALFPKHAECAACHSQTGSKPHLSAASTSADCRGCHQPEAIENSAAVTLGKYVDIKFHHRTHFTIKNARKLDCTTCHYSMLKSKSLADLSLPKMIDCVECHDTSKAIAKQSPLSRCSTCHDDRISGPAPSSHLRHVKPAFHTPSFRQHHEEEASEPGAKCFACHQNVRPSAEGTNQCTSCHRVMRPASHTSRWKDDLHGKYAAIDRESCATCHPSDSCSRCHNEVPRSHLPLQLFRAGTHQQLAMLNERACFTCHTFQNTCSHCHTRTLRKQ